MVKLKPFRKRSNPLTKKVLEMNIRNVSPFFKKLAEDLKLPEDIRKSSLDFYVNLVKNGGIEGKNSKIVICAVVYLICRQKEFLVTLKDIAKLTKIYSIKHIGRIYRQIVRDEGGIRPPNYPLEKYLERFAFILNLSQNNNNKSLEILNKLKEKNSFGEKTAGGLISGIIYYAGHLTGEKNTQHEVAKACGVAEDCVRKNYYYIIGVLKDD